MALEKICPPQSNNNTEALWILDRKQETMRVGMINFPNTAKLLKGLSLLMCFLLLICFWSLAMDIFQQTQSAATLLTSLRSRQLEFEKYKNRKNSNLASYQKSICMDFSGRLGNHMFQFASAYGIAKAKNMRMRVYKHDTIAKVFNLSVPHVVNSHHCDHARAKSERFHCAYDQNLLNINPNYETKFLSYLQSWKYFMNVTSDIRREFTFQRHIMKQAKSAFYNATHGTKYFRQNGTYVGLHIRRGDMVVGQSRGQRFGYNVAPRGYAIRAINYFLVKHRKVTFIVCSDGIAWVKKEFGKYANLLQIVFIEKNTPEVDLAVLSLCDHMIMTTGTFSWWAGWLTGGTVVYYKKYIKDNSDLRKQFSKDFSDYFYPHWIAME